MGAYSYYCAKVQPHLQGLLQRWNETSAALQRIPDEQDAAIATLEAEAITPATKYCRQHNLLHRLLFLVH